MDKVDWLDTPREDERAFAVQQLGESA